MNKAHWFIKLATSKLSPKDAQKSGALLSSMHHFDPLTGKVRQRRAERRSSHALVLEQLIKRMDFDTMGVGMFMTRHDGTVDFWTVGRNEIAKECGIDKCTVTRVFQDFEKAGLMTSERQQALGKDGDIVRHYSHRKLTTKLFKELGVEQKDLSKVRHFKQKENERKFYRKPMCETFKNGTGKIKSILKKFVDGAASIKNNPKSRYTPSYSKKTYNPACDQSLMKRAVQIAEKTCRDTIDVFKELVAIKT